MAVATNNEPKVAVVTKFREFYKTDKYLGGLIKINRVVETQKVGHSIYIMIPNSIQYDEFYINGINIKPNGDK